MERINNLHCNELLVDKFYPYVNAYYFKNWLNFSTGLHSHKHIEIMYVLHGSCIIETKSETIQMKKGDFILIDENVIHKLIVDASSCRMMNIEFFFAKQDICYPSFNEIAESTKILKFLVKQPYEYIYLKDSEQIYYPLKSLIMELDKKCSDNELLIQIMLSEILIKIAQFAKEAHNEGNQKGTIYIRKAINYINSHYDSNITIKDIATYINIHPTYLQRIFKQCVGTTIVDYIINIRLEKTKLLLSNTNISVTEICEYVGINSVQYLNFLFKKSTGSTPIGYRNDKCKNYREKSKIIL